jgi:hypothetical protein
MLKKISIIIILLLISFLAGYYYAPDKVKEVEKIIYKDKIINEVQTVIKYKDGTEKIVTVTNTVEKEVQKEKTIEKINNYTSELAPIVGFNHNLQLDSIGAMYFYKLIGRIYVGAGFSYRIDAPDIYYIGDNIQKESPSFFDKTTLLLSIKIPFNI